MRKVQRKICCSRCGGEISEEEFAFLSGSACALCEQMQFEAFEIWDEVHKQASRTPVSEVIGPLRVNSR